MEVTLTLNGKKKKIKREDFEKKYCPEKELAKQERNM